MKRCKHTWEPLIKIDVGPGNKELKQMLAIDVALSRLNRYMRCSQCGRLFYHGRGRGLVSNMGIAELILEKAERLQLWIDLEIRKADVPEMTMPEYIEECEKCP